MGKVHVLGPVPTTMSDMRRALLVTVFLISFVLTPISAFAAESTFFGPVVPPECNCPSVISPNTGKAVPSAADWGCVLQTVQNSMNLAVSISVIIVVLAVVYAGLVFMLSATNPENRKKGRQLVTNAFLGMLVVFSAWVFVDFIMKVLYNPDTSVEGVAFGPWNAILSGDGPKCIQVAKTPDALPAVIGQPPPGPSPVGGVAGSGSCTPPSGPPCSIASLQQTCFANVADQAAQICNAESGNNPQSESRTDRTADGYAYSVGLFQINLTNSFTQRVNGQKCDDAFTEPCQGSAVVQSGPNTGSCRARIKDMRLYQSCVSAAKNASTNIAVACTLYDGDWGRWSTSKPEVCNLPR